MTAVQKIQQWVALQLQVEVTELSWQPLSGDASFRRYFRCVLDGKSYMVALAPPETEKNHEFVLISKLLQQASVKAPAVLAVDYDNGYLLQNDLGDRLLMAELNADSVDSWYHKAMLQLEQMLFVDQQGLASLPLYDEEALALELSYFDTWFLQAMLNYHCDAAESAMLQQFFQLLLGSALTQPQVFVHRDYHCRNIMIDEDSELATIDFQDAVCGPITYDLVSLLRDCYCVWPQRQVTDWVEHYWQLLHQHQLIDVNEATFHRWFDLMGLQRHIKVLGVFSRLSIRDGKEDYLNDLPTVVTYVRTVAAEQPEAEAFCLWFDEKILPLIRQQSWGVFCE